MNLVSSLKKSKDKKPSIDSQKDPEGALLEREKHAAKKKHDEEKRLEEELEYNRFPTIMGWYFDGFSVEPFGLKEQWAIYFNDLQDEIEAIEEFENEETFTEKARRNFWPPTYHGSFFRTRGIYLDFKEVIKDPPRTPPEINFDHDRRVISVVEPPPDDDELPSAGASGARIESFADVEVFSGDGRKIRVQIADKDRFYFDELAGEFLLRTEAIDVYFDQEFHVWRKIHGLRKTPYHYYFDIIEGKFRIRDRGHSDDYTWDPTANVWRKKNQLGIQPKKDVKGMEDYYFDEVEGVWYPIPKDAAPNTNIVDFPMGGGRKVRKRGRGGSGKGPEEFYYDGSKCAVLPKDPAKLKDYEYDPWVNIWRLKGKPRSINSDGPSAIDFIWSDKTGLWTPRMHEEWEQAGPYDYYFDDAVGRFLPRDRMRREDYVFDEKFSVCKKRNVKGPAANGLGPDDYYYCETRGTWELVDSAPPEENVVEHPTILRRKISKGQRGLSGKAPDEYYYDGNDGVFHHKERNTVKDYFFDVCDEVWRKAVQFGGPGKSGLYPEEFYFDAKSGSWKEKSGNVKLLKHEDLLTKSPYDWYFDDKKGEFLKRDPNDPGKYAYDPDYNVWKRKGGTCQAQSGVDVKSYFFDENEGSWFKIEGSAHKGETQVYRNGGGRNTLFGQRGKNGKCSDDYYYDTGDERYRLKGEGIDYEYKPELGCWLFSGSESALSKCKDKPEDFYFDDYDGSFFLKKEQKKRVDFIFDKNAHMWRKDRHRPQDFHWDANARRWIAKERHKHGRDTEQSKASSVRSSVMTPRESVINPLPLPKKSISQVRKQTKANIKQKKKKKKTELIELTAETASMAADIEPEPSVKASGPPEDHLDVVLAKPLKTTKTKTGVKAKSKPRKYPVAKADGGIEGVSVAQTSWTNPAYKYSEKRLKHDSPGETTF